MRAAVVTQLTGPSGVDLQSRTDPAIGPDEALVRTLNAGVTLPEVLRTYGKYQDRSPVPFILGSEFCGRVVESNIPDIKPGDRVAGQTSTGAYADLLSVHRSSLLKVPETMASDTAATLPINYMTAVYSLRERARLVKEDILLVRGGGGGLGLASIQVAKFLGCSMILSTGSTEAKRIAALKAGANFAFHESELVDQVARRVGDRRVTVVVDPVGGKRLEDALRVLAPWGRYLILGFASGEIPVIEANRLLLRDISVLGVYLGLHVKQHPEYLHQAWDVICQGFSQGFISPAIESVFDIDEVRLALQKVENRDVVGKVVLKF